MKIQGDFVRYLLIFLLLVLSSQVVAEDSFWTPLASNLKQLVLKPTPALKKKPIFYFQLDEIGFKQHLEGKFAFKNNNNPVATSLSVQLPLLEGKLVTLEVTETSVMASELSKKYPDIKHWQVKGIDDPHIYGVIGFTTLGFHAMIFMPDGDTLFVERKQVHEFKVESASSIYAVMSKRSSTQKNHFSCDAHSSSSPLASVKDNHLSADFSAKQARGMVTYRLAMAATGEYTTELGGKANAMSEIAKTVARLNVLYARDLALTFQLVENNDAIVFTNANTDPYSNGGSIKLLADENAWQRDSSNRISGEGVIDRFIGNANYDIGHVMSVTRGGVAIVGGVCQANSTSGNHKAGASTGSANPTGENFYIDFVAHEIGHQLGATHTFNSSTGSCAGAERSAATAYEPGSGSSIMAYAGICSPNNVQTHSDAAFHIASIEQIDDYVRREQGSLCGIRGASTNNAPDILTVTENFTVNANTAFTLTGTAADSDGDALSYAWDQFDQGTASSINVDQGDNALFRSRLPSALANRNFSSLATTNRDITFKFVVRDGKGGVSSRTTTVHVVNGSRASSIGDNGGSGSTTLLMLLSMLLLALLRMLYRKTK
jgi:hypothetical protein